MKKISKIIGASLKLFILAVVLGTFTKCEIQDDFKYQSSPTNANLGKTCWGFIQERTDIMSMMQDAINRAQMQSYYSEDKGYTYILPRNNAWTKYLKSKSYTAISDIPVAELQNILKYHLVKAKVNFSDPVLITSNNPIAYDTESGSIMYLSHNTNFQGLINQNTKKSWTIITSNLVPTNGVIHVVDDVVYLSQ
ncbi:conserved exported hypothetical protein [uncultured Paludibacter sp.]|nr:conserved exported hypothetical protein [uncultured Paludibacter sp.]